MSNNENSVLAPINANASVAKDNGTAMSKTDAILNLIAKLTAALAENTAALKTGLGATVSAIASNTSAITAGFTANTTAVITIAEGIDTLNVNTVALGTFQERLARALEDMGAREVRRTLVQVFTYEGIALMLVAEFLTNTRDTHFIHFRAKASCSVKNDLAQPFCYFVSKRLPSQEPTVKVAGDILVHHLTHVRETAGANLNNIDEGHPIRAFQSRYGRLRNVLKCWEVSGIDFAQAFNEAAPAYQAA